MSALFRISQQVSRKEARKWQRGPFLYRRDILDTLRYWRWVRRNSAHCAEQYALARATAFGGVK